MENNQQNKSPKRELKNDSTDNTEVKQEQNVQSNENKNLSSTAERHSESSLPKGTNETLGTP